MVHSLTPETGAFEADACLEARRADDNLGGGLGIFNIQPGQVQLECWRDPCSLAALDARPAI